MNQNKLAEALAQYIDDLLDIKKSKVAPSPLLPPDLQRALGPLFDLARYLRRALAPVEPADAFVQDLATQLLAARPETSRTKTLVRSGWLSRGLLIRTVAVCSLVSAAAIVAIVRARSNPQSKSAA
ncbi:MAG: hypothetical protein M1136_03805 [Chloroflexi bacterium]|nr:hypothetical protein [Chloroflexota bacterium]MCL5074764.1 hypothetical protein [Chloroflexota bacterium]